MKCLTAVIVAAVFALLFAGGSAAAPPSTVSRYDTVMDYGQSVRVSSTPEVCGLSRAPTRVRIQDKTWTKLEMSPVFFCWASKNGKPIVGGRVMMAYWIRGESVVADTTWKKGGKFHPYPVYLYPDRLSSIRSLEWGTVYSLDLQEVPLSADQLAGKVRKISDVMGRRIVPRDARVAQAFGCNVQSDLLVQCGRAGVWNGWSAAFWASPPWRALDVQGYYENPFCGCQSQVFYDPSGISG